MIAIVGLGWLGAYGALPWLPALACPASSFGMLAYMLLRREQFTSRADHTANGIHH
jgi:hypothetical protein